MILDQLEKNSEFTYGVHARSLLELVADGEASPMYPNDAQITLNALDSMVMGSVRSLNHTFELHRQAIAYCLPFRFNEANEVEFLVYLRNKMNNEGQLTQKLSLAPGGHVDRYDLQYHQLKNEDRALYSTPNIDFSSTLKANLKRELAEEVRFWLAELLNEKTTKDQASDTICSAAAAQSMPVGFVMDSQAKPGYVGNIHFGAVYATPVPRNVEFEMKEKHNTAVGFFTLLQLAQHVTKHKLIETAEKAEFEPWSELIIAKLDVFSKIIKTMWGK